MGCLNSIHMTRYILPLKDGSSFEYALVHKVSSSSREKETRSVVADVIR